jgi:hypothetical protein
MVTGSVSPKDPELTLAGRLGSIAEEAGVDSNLGPFLDEAMDKLVKRPHKKYQQSVVALVDEYDDPLARAFPDLPLAQSLRDVLAPFYAALKSNDNIIRFSMVAGITRFALTGLSGGANQMADLGRGPSCAAIRGFTSDELDRHFSDRCPEALEAAKKAGDPPEDAGEDYPRRLILGWYDGRSFDGRTRVMNPVSILGFFTTCDFAPHWVGTMPTSTVRAKFGPFPDPEAVGRDLVEGSPEKDLDLMAVESPKGVPLLFQTGYLAIGEIARVDSNPDHGGLFQTKTNIYKFRKPNFEASSAFSEIMASIFFPKFICDN